MTFPALLIRTIRREIGAGGLAAVKRQSQAQNAIEPFPREGFAEIHLQSLTDKQEQVSQARR
jgi:hypothetical protein